MEREMEKILRSFLPYGGEDFEFFELCGHLVAELPSDHPGFNPYGRGLLYHGDIKKTQDGYVVHLSYWGDGQEDEEEEIFIPFSEVDEWGK